MENRLKNEPTQEIAEALQNNDSASAAQKIQEYLKQQENIPLNIAVTGESGSADRFTENDVKLALAIQKMGKMLYFVRSKIDNNLRDAERSQRDFNQAETLDKIRKYCCKGLRDNGVKSVKVFLISNFDVGLYDFQLLEDTLEKELPEHKRNALLFAIPNINEGILNKRKEAFQAEIKYCASLSALIAAAPIPGFALMVELDILVTIINKYVLGFGLDGKSLQKLARSTKTPLNDLHAVMRSPFVLKEINKEMILKELTMSVSGFTLVLVKEVTRFMTLFGIPAASGISFHQTYSFLDNCLEVFAKDAQNVLMKALKVNP
ncbi:interferon-inducible GTPase 5-like isoform X2 [Lampris incognitus]|uniref:interferon-inducible GTPase 5-like isoform X2 n=1 Tax=Lampris incognitus TaxID=2546036 RepID=UPI0024B634E4|nr:interferon-inducible GTPase 5-like isoform X2 [Lampris incognitus]